MVKTELIGLSKEEIAQEIAKLGEKPFRAKQLWQWLYFHGVTDFEKMTTLRPKDRNGLYSRR